MRCLSIALLLTLQLSALADEEAPVPAPPVAASVASGAALMLASMAVGGTLLTEGQGMWTRNAGTLTMVSGLALAPVMSHLIAHEWTRAALFGAVPVASAAGMVALLSTHPGVTTAGDKRATRIVYFTLVSLSAVSSLIGVLDSLLAGERARARHLQVAPIVGPELGLAVGGAL